MSSVVTHDGVLVLDGRPTYGTARALGYDEGVTAGCAQGLGVPRLVTSRDISTVDG